VYILLKFNLRLMEIKIIDIIKQMTTFLLKIVMSASYSYRDFKT
jgi:hypothetical protein